MRVDESEMVCVCVGVWACGRGFFCSLGHELDLPSFVTLLHVPCTWPSMANNIKFDVLIASKIRTFLFNLT